MHLANPRSSDLHPPQFARRELLLTVLVVAVCLTVFRYWQIGGAVLAWRASVT